MSKQTQQGHELTEKQITDFGLEETPAESGRSIEEIVINLYGENKSNEQINRKERN